jgi:hypothetical protein
MAKKLNPLKNQSDVLQEELNNYDKTYGKSSSDTVFDQNRGLETSLKGKNIKKLSITLQDHDEAIKYYIDNVIQPTVTTNGTTISVPVIYSNPERWVSIQRDGSYRDKNGKLMFPLIAYTRQSVTKDRNLGNKLDSNKIHNYQSFQRIFSKNNQYDKFSVLNNRIPTKEIYMSVVPDYIDISYSAIIITDYVEHMNSLIEDFNFASDSYWGDPNRFKFRTTIDTFNTLQEINISDSRLVRTTFTISLKGYIIPNNIQEYKAGTSLRYSKSQVIFNSEIESTNI